MPETRTKMMMAVSLESEDAKTPGEKMPLHVSVTPPFMIDGTDIADLRRHSDQIASTLPRFSIVGKEEAYFGDDASIRVRKVGGSTLIAVHESFYNLATQFDNDIDSTFAGQRYQPHCTYQGEKGLEQGESREIKTLDMYEKTGRFWRIKYTSVFGDVEPPVLTEIFVEDV